MRCHFYQDLSINCNNDFSAAVDVYAIRLKSLRAFANIHAGVLYRIVPKIMEALLLEITSSTWSNQWAQLFCSYVPFSNKTRSLRCICQSRTTQFSSIAFPQGVPRWSQRIPHCLPRQRCIQISQFPVQNDLHQTPLRTSQACVYTPICNAIPEIGEILFLQGLSRLRITGKCTNSGPR